MVIANKAMAYTGSGPEQGTHSGDGGCGGRLEQGRGVSLFAKWYAKDKNGDVGITVTPLIVFGMCSKLIRCMTILVDAF